MPNTPYPDNWYEIDKALYNRSVRVFNTVKKVLSVKMQLHADTHQVQQGDIFLFNHFSRFETFIPQYLIYEQTGAYTCVIGSSEFFKQDTVLARYFQQVGVFPTDHDRLFSLLAAQIMRGRKVAIFPEGGMVKDHRVIDEKGNYSIYSRMTGQRRKQHTGAAVLAQGVEAIKIIVRHAYHQKNHAQLVWWKEQLQMDSLDQLLASALKHTLIIPANITFYPIRTSENLMVKAVDFFTDSLSLRHTEELLIEGNIILKNTDMDIRMGKPLEPFDHNSIDGKLLHDLMANAKSMDEIFTFQAHPQNPDQKHLGEYFKEAANATRDQYMKEIYLNVTINLSHLASALIMHLIKQGQIQIERQRFFTTLYIAVKLLQNTADINLHRSLLNPIDYSELISGTGTRFEHYIEEAKNTGLISEDGNHYNLLPKLLEEHDFDSIRLENMIAVYDNEAKPITQVLETIIHALSESDDVDQQELAAWHFEDECRDLTWEHHAYNKPIYDDINDQETASADATPFFLDPPDNKDNGIGVLLIHGLLASPAELRDYGEHLVKQGYTVIGVRLKGHGSSPYALQNQTWEDWYHSVLRGYKILRAHSNRIFVTGFSTGGALALKLASEPFPEIIGISVVALPIKFINSAFMLVPLLHGTNKLVDWLSSFEGVKPFIENPTEHPLINYRNVPVKALYELRQLIERMDDFAPLCKTPVLVLQGDNDPVVAFKSAEEIMKKLTCKNKQLKIISSNRHGILMENIGGVWETIDAFMKECTRETKTK